MPGHWNQKSRFLMASACHSINLEIRFCNFWTVTWTWLCWVWLRYQSEPWDASPSSPGKEAWLSVLVPKGLPDMVMSDIFIPCSSYSLLFSCLPNRSGHCSSSICFGWGSCKCCPFISLDARPVSGVLQLEAASIDQINYPELNREQPRSTAGVYDTKRRTLYP